MSVAAAMPAIPGMPAPVKALCLAPYGMEEGTEAHVEDQEFVIVVGEEVSFDIMESACRHEDGVGTVVEEWEQGEIEEMTTIETVLEGEHGSVIPVTIEIKVTEIGTLEFWCVSREDGQRWKLEFNVRERDDFESKEIIAILLRRLHEVAFILIITSVIFFLIALASYSRTDPGWSLATTNPEIKNVAGIVGAYTADLLLSIFGTEFVIPYLTNKSVVCFVE